MRIALVHDWLTGMRGGEKCLEVLCEMFPEAPIYTIVYRPGSVSSLITSHKIHTSFIQRLPLGVRHYRRFLPLFPAAVEHFELRGFDLVISSSHCAAKGVVVHAGTRHLCYCHTPMRYVWNAYEEYFGGARARTPTGLAMTLLAPWLRAWDVNTSRRVDHFVANSRTVAGRIERYYGRSASVVHPWVDTDVFVPANVPGEHPGEHPGDDPREGPYLMVTALVPYKRVELAVQAAARANLDLVVVGEGPERRRLERIAGPKVRFTGWLETGELVRQYQSCRALLFPGEEDFGIVPLEAMACGRPVVALGRGGATETVVEGETGVFFDAPEPESLAEAIQRLEAGRWDPERIRRRALEFSRDRYRQGMEREIQRVMEAPGDRARRGEPEVESWATLSGASGRPGSSSSGI
jgi:glycosyltransferase involved in cell wall biosynthesis